MVSGDIARQRLGQTLLSAHNEAQAKAHGRVLQVSQLGRRQQERCGQY